MISEKSAAKKRLVLFIVLAVVIAWAVFLMIPAFGLTYGKGLSLVILTAAMLVPALSNILTRLITREGFRDMYLRPHLKGRVGWYLLVWFGPTVLLFLSGAVYFLIFPASFDPSLSALKSAAAAAGKAGLTPQALLLLSGAQVILLGPIVNIIPTMGEELGWRGYLLPKLRLFLSDRAALVVTGVIWGMWHIPVIVMGHNYGTSYAGYPWLGILAMIVFCVMLGIIEGYVSIRLQSAVPAAMIHSTVNAGAGFPNYLASPGYNPLLGPAITGLLGALPFLALAAIFLVKASSRTRQSRGK